MLTKGDLVQFLPITGKNIEINIAIDARNFASATVLPKLPFTATGQHRFFLAVTCDPERILVEMTSQVLVVKFEKFLN